ncbi:hypothetical protein FACS1894103_1080 [Campylobacterota bacterium]|nr:hypothetical protein FACS1894103_1080 [Campylobacterota bacterium]
MENEFDYYLIERKSDQTYPLVKEVGYEPDDINPTLIKIAFNDPIPQKPVMADFLKGADCFINQKIADVIIGFKLDYIKLTDTKWVGKQKNITEKYYHLMVDNDIAAMDKEKSEYVYKYRVYSIRQFALDRESLKKIPLKKRLIFVLEEAPSNVVFHKSVVDAIMAENPTGVQFRPIEEWAF